MGRPELVQLATDLLADSKNPDRWLPLYDAALESDSDALLLSFIGQISPKNTASLAA